MRTTCAVVLFILLGAGACKRPGHTDDPSPAETAAVRAPDVGVEETPRPEPESPAPEEYADDAHEMLFIPTAAIHDGEAIYENQTESDITAEHGAATVTYFWTRETHYPISKVGPYFTWETTGENLAGRKPTDLFFEWRTIDLRDGDEVEVTELVDEASLLDAMKEHPQLASKLEDADDFASARNALPGEMVGFGIAGANDEMLTVELALQVNLWDGKTPCEECFESIRLEVAPGDAVKPFIGRDSNFFYDGTCPTPLETAEGCAVGPSGSGSLTATIDDGADEAPADATKGDPDAHDGTYHVTFIPTAAVYAGEPLYTDTMEPGEKADVGHEDADVYHWRRERHVPISKLGPLVTWESLTERLVGHERKGYDWRWKTVDVRDRSEVVITEMVDASDLFQALKAHPKLASKLRKATDFAAARRVFGDSFKGFGLAGVRGDVLELELAFARGWLEGESDCERCFASVQVEVRASDAVSRFLTADENFFHDGGCPEPLRGEGSCLIEPGPADRY